MSSFHIPFLRIKLKKLYSSGRNPDIASDQQLATKLGISAKAIENWVHGFGGMTPNAIPNGRISYICQLFNIESEDLKLEDMARFDSRLKRGVSAWSKIFQRSQMQESDQTQKTHPEASIKLQTHRGVGLPYDVSDDMEGEVLTLDERFRFVIKAQPNWWVVTLIQDPLDLICLCPSKKYKSYQIGSEKALTLPPESLNPVYATKPTGQHWVLAIFSRSRLPLHLEEGLQDTLIDTQKKAIEDLEAWLACQNEQEYFVLRLPFYVSEYPSSQ